MIARRLTPVSVTGFFATILLMLSACQSTQPEAKSENLSQEEVLSRRQQIDTMAEAGLARLLKENPRAESELHAAAGYAVFDVNSLNAVLLVGSRGKGVIVENKTSKHTYMRTVRAGTGPGIGYQQLNQIFIFKTKQALDQFKLGNSAGGDVGASATVGSSNTQMSFNPHITVYEIREKGFAVQANWGGTAYLVDPDLN